GGNPVPMALDHLSKLLVGLQALPLQGSAPVRKEAARPAFPLVVPQLAERLLEHISGGQPLVGPEQCLKSATTIAGRILPARQQGILLPLDEVTILPAQAGILALAHLV